MADPVKSYDLSGYDGDMIEVEDGAWYHVADYERLEQECERLRDELDNIKRSWSLLYAECDYAKCQAELFNRAAEVFREDKTAALQLLAKCQEHLDPHRDAVLWGQVVEALRCAPTK